MKQNEKHIKPITPTLDNLKSKNGFEVPGNYFDSLHNSILENTKEEEAKVIYFTPRKTMAYAASVIVLLSVSTFVFNNSTTLDNELALNNTTSEGFFDELTESDIDLETSIEFDEILANF